MADDKENGSTGRMLASLICIVFYSILLGFLSGELGRDIPATTSSSTISQGLKIMGYLMAIMVSVALVRETEKTLQKIGFGTMALSAAVFMLESFAFLDPSVVVWLQACFSVVIIVSLAGSVYLGPGERKGSRIFF